VTGVQTCALPIFQKAGLFDKQGDMVKFTLGEFRETNHGDNSIVKEFRPEAFPDGSTGFGN
jgi:hypothetical protein